MFSRKGTLDSSIKFFIETTPWTNNVTKYAGFMHSVDIPFTPVTRRRQIEDFTHDPLYFMKEGDYHLTKASDHDHINEKKIHDFIGGEERKRAYRTAYNNGASLEAIAEYKAILKGGQVAKNINDMIEVGFKVRCLDDPLYGALNCIGGKKSICVWQSVQMDPNYKRADGFPQDPSRMSYEGLILDGESPHHEPFISSFESRFRELWEESVPAESLLALVDEKRNGSLFANFPSIRNGSEENRLNPAR